MVYPTEGGANMRRSDPQLRRLPKAVGGAFGKFNISSKAEKQPLSMADLCLSVGSLTSGPRAEGCTGYQSKRLPPFCCKCCCAYHSPNLNAKRTVQSSPLSLPFCSL